MAYRIEYMPEAYHDIDAVITYLYGFYRDTAASFSRTLEHRVRQLADHPYMAEPWENDPKFRKLVVGDYLVFYLVYDDANTVEIHRILRATWNIRRL